MKALLVTCTEKPKVVELEPELEAMQEFVGGSIQAVYPFDDPVAVVCNEEGKLIGLPANRELRDEHGEIYDILHGDFFVAGLGKEEFCDLSDELAEKYTAVFGGPRLFFWDSDCHKIRCIELEGGDF